MTSYVLLYINTCLRTIPKTDFQSEDVLVWRSVLSLMERNLSFVLGLHPMHTHNLTTIEFLHSIGYKWISVIKWFERSSQDERIPGSSPRRTWSLYLHMFTSAAWLVYQRLNCAVWIDCDSCTLGSEYGNIANPSIPILADVWVTVPQCGSTAVIRIMLKEWTQKKNG
jgi:hypothetical protein